MARPTRTAANVAAAMGTATAVVPPVQPIDPATVTRESIEKDFAKLHETTDAKATNSEAYKVAVRDVHIHAAFAARINDMTGEDMAKLYHGADKFAKFAPRTKVQRASDWKAIMAAGAAQPQRFNNKLWEDCGGVNKFREVCRHIAANPTCGDADVKAVIDAQEMVYDGDTVNEIMALITSLQDDDFVADIAPHVDGITKIVAEYRAGGELKTKAESRSKSNGKRKLSLAERMATALSARATPQ